MNTQIMQLKIEKQKTEKKLQELKIKIVRILHELASNINPYYDEISEIKAAEIEQAGDELLQVWIEAKNSEEKLAKIQKELGND